MSGGGQPLLLVEGLAKRRAGDDRSFTLRVPHLALAPGESLALVGPSGCGKSTVIDLLALALAPDEAGRFRLRSAGGWFDVAAAWRKGQEDRLGRARAEMLGYVLQTGGLLPFLTAGRNIALPAEIAGRHDAAWIRDLAKRLGILPLLDEMPARLSVGQRQRVAVARALAARPPLVLADEPTASLDPANAEVVMGLLLEATRHAGAALLLATHDWELVARHGLPRATFELGQKGNAVTARLVEAA